MEDLILKANQWAQNIWTKAVPKWEKRIQDHSYRDILVRPGIYTALKSIKLKTNGQFLDIGCGEGAETFYIRNLLVQLGYSGIMYAYDPQSHFIGVAENVNKPHPAIPIQFGNGSIDEFLEKYNLSKNVDLVTSIFVLQDLPDIHKHLADVDGVLSEESVGIFLLVHPNFGEAMRKKGAVKIEESLSPQGVNVPWQFVGEYPIVEENGRTFFVPYFQRTVDDYRKYFQKYFSQIDFAGLKPSPQDIKRCERECRSPFYNHDGNIYYPEIVEMESSLVIIVKR